MSQNPLYNAAAAIVYVILVVSLITVGSQFASGPDTIVIPIAMLSLLVLSVTVMAYLFFYQPILLLIDGKQREAVSLFGKTVAWFAGCTIVLLFAALLI